MREIWKTGLKGQRMIFALLILISILSGFVTALQPSVTGKIIDIVSKGSKDQARIIVLVLIVIFLADSVLNILGAFMGAIVNGRFSYQLREKTLRSACFQQLGKAPVVERADIQNRILIDASLANQAIVGTVPQAVSSSILLICCIVGMVSSLPDVFFVLVLIISLVSLLAYFLGQAIRCLNTKTREIASVYASSLWHILSSLKSLKSRNMIPWALSKASLDSKLLCRASIKRDFTAGVMLPALNIGTQVSLVLTVAMATTGIVTGTIVVSDGTSFIMFLLYSISPLVQLGTLVPQWFSGDSSGKRLEVMWNLPLEEEGTDILKSSSAPSLCFKNVCYNFPGETSFSLDNFNLSLRGPGLFSLQGPNGSGKSTILFLSNGIYLGKGDIEVNGKNIRDINNLSLRSNVFVVDQNREPINGTLRDNLGIGTAVTDEERIAMIQRTGFDKHLSDLDAIIGESGIVLSGGQRSLLAISDALLREPQVLLLDEITAGVDKETLPLVIALLEDYSQSHLVIAVSHDDSLAAISTRNISIEGENSD